MEKEEQLFRKRIQELAENAYSRDIPLHTDFLTLAEQTVFQNMSGYTAAGEVRTFRRLSDV